MGAFKTSECATGALKLHGWVCPAFTATLEISNHHNYFADYKCGGVQIMAAYT